MNASFCNSVPNLSLCKEAAPLEEQTELSNGKRRPRRDRGRAMGNAWTPWPTECVGVDTNDAEAAAEVTSKDMEEMLPEATPEQRKRVVGPVHGGQEPEAVQPE